MTQAHWAMRFYLPFNENESIDFIGNFEGAGKRFLDDIVVFSGIYGIPDYLMWYIHKDMTSYNFSNFSIDLKLFLGGDTDNSYFQENYRIVDIGDDFKSDRKVVYAIHEDYVKLEALLIDAHITTLDYNDKRTVEELLRNVLEDSGIYPVVFCEHKEKELESIKFEYAKFTVDPSWSVRDFIQYVAVENNFEWTIKHGILFIGPELYSYREMKASKDAINRQVDNISKNYWNMKIAWGASPLDVLYNYELVDEEKITDMRCIWAKHTVGTSGDSTKGCFVPVGISVNKTTYIQTLEGMKEITNAYHHLFKVVKHHQLSLARVTKDEGDTQFVDEVTVQKNIDEYAIKTPRNVKMETKEHIYSLPNVGRTTPYLDSAYGILFPRAQDPEDTPNQLLMAIDDRVEEAVLGPFVMGNGNRNFVIPAKGPNDFRLQLPIEGGGDFGWCLYHNFEERQTYLIPHDGDPLEIIGDQGGDPPDDKFWIKIGHTPKILVNISADTFISVQNNETINVVSKSEINVTSDQDVNINCGGAKEVKINSGGVAVSLTGHKHPLVNHTHQVTPGPAIPGPPATAAPASSTIQGETDKHSKHLKAVQG